MKPPLPSSSVPRAQKKNPPPAKSSGLLLLFFLALALAGGGLAWWEHARIASLEQQLADSQTALAEAKTRASRALNPDRAAAPAAPLPQPEEPPAAPDPADARQRGTAMLGAILNNPQMQQLAEGMTRTLVTSAYAGLIQQLNLSPEQGAAFNELVAQRALIGQEVLRNATSQGLDLAANADQLRQQVSQGQAQVDQQIHGVLGDGGFQQYQDYNRTLPQQLGRGAGLPAGN
jgi:hypothetical protein